MSDGYIDAVANAGRSLITHIGLVNALGTELDLETAYERQAVTWTEAPASGVGTIRPNADLTFDIPAGAEVAGWRGFSADSGGTNYGGADFTEAESYTNAGEFKLIGSQTGVIISASE